MLFKNQISITADSGVGSTTTAKKLHNYLGISPWRWVNAGAIMRIFAKELGISIEEFAHYNLTHLEERYDERCDNMIKEFAKQDYVIFEGRLVHYFAPGSFHVRLICDPLIRAERRSKDLNLSIEEMLKKITERDKSNKERYEKLYGPEVLWNNDKFDLVLDTGVLSPDEIALTIIDKHKEWVSKNL